MNKTLITGGAGLIGSNIAKRLLKRGHDVIIYDPFIQYTSPFKILVKNYYELRFQGIVDSIIFERGETTNISHLREIIKTHRPNYILHLGAMPIADLSNTNIEEAFSSILMGTINILEVIKNLDHIDKFLYTSSSMAYGDFKTIPCPEDHIKNPKDIYGGIKYTGEIMTRIFAYRFNIPYCIVRPSAVYGPYDVNRRVSQIFVEKAMLGEKLRVDGGGNICLDFTYVDDIAQGLELALLSDKSCSEDFNITYGKSYTLLEFVETLKKILPTTQYYISENKDDFRPKRGALSIEKAKKILGYIPIFPLEKGLQEYVDSYKKLSFFKKK